MPLWCCSGGNAAGNYQILAPAYYDQSGQFVVSGNAARTPVRLVSPAPILVNTATGQQGCVFAVYLMVLILTCSYDYYYYCHFMAGIWDNLLVTTCS